MKVWNSRKKLKLLFILMLIPVSIGVILYPYFLQLNELSAPEARFWCACTLTVGIVVGGCGTVAMAIIYQRLRELKNTEEKNGMVVPFQKQS